MTDRTDQTKVKTVSVDNKLRLLFVDVDSSIVYVQIYKKVIKYTK